MTGAVGGYLVVDASVALKWALDDEEEVERALALRNDGLRGRFVMLAPSLWVYEVANGLVVALRRRRVTRSLAGEALSLLLGVGVRLADPGAGECFTAANRFGLWAYDAAYLALADAVEGQLWTGDRRLFERVADTTSGIRWIGDYPT